MHFGNSEEKEIKKQNEKQRLQLINDLQTHLNNVTVYLGDLGEYERFAGYECEAIKMRGSEQFVYFDRMGAGNSYDKIDLEDREYLVDEKIEALVNVQIIDHQSRGGPIEYGCVGTPVRKKQ